MANPKDMMMKAKMAETSSMINQLISRAFTTRNLAHFFHWNTGSFAAHAASGELYDLVIDKIDEIVEVYQGKYGLIKNASTMAASVPDCLCDHVKQEAEWVAQNKTAIAGGCEPIMNLIDDLGAAYLKVIYKLENLK